MNPYGSVSLYENNKVYDTKLVRMYAFQYIYMYRNDEVVLKVF